jgi:hypothetical protein
MMVRALCRAWDCRNTSRCTCSNLVALATVADVVTLVDQKPHHRAPRLG